jgi:hypothetical protein
MRFAKRSRLSQFATCSRIRFAFCNAQLPSFGGAGMPFRRRNIGAKIARAGDHGCD